MQSGAGHFMVSQWTHVFRGHYNELNQLGQAYCTHPVFKSGNIFDVKDRYTKLSSLYKVKLFQKQLSSGKITLKKISKKKASFSYFQVLLIIILQALSTSGCSADATWCCQLYRFGCRQLSRPQTSLPHMRPSSLVGFTPLLTHLHYNTDVSHAIVPSTPTFLSMLWIIWLRI